MANLDENCINSNNFMKKLEADNNKQPEGSGAKLSIKKSKDTKAKEQ